VLEGVWVGMIFWRVIRFDIYYLFYIDMHSCIVMLDIGCEFSVMSRLWLHRTGYRSLETCFCFLDFRCCFGCYLGFLRVECGVMVLFGGVGGFYWYLWGWYGEIWVGFWGFWVNSGGLKMA